MFHQLSAVSIIIVLFFLQELKTPCPKSYNCEKIQDFFLKLIVIIIKTFSKIRGFCGRIKFENLQ